MEANYKIVHYYTSFIRRLIVTRNGWGSGPLWGVLQQNECHSASYKTSVIYYFFYFGRINLIKLKNLIMK
jgi:hypothetical protein